MVLSVPALGIQEFLRHVLESHVCVRASQDQELGA